MVPRRPPARRRGARVRRAPTGTSARGAWRLPYHRPPAGRKPASILHRRAPFLRRTPHSLARRIFAILRLRRWHVTCCPAFGMDDNAGNLIHTLRHMLRLYMEEFSLVLQVHVYYVTRF